MPSTTYTILKNRILTKLQGITKLQEVVDYPKLEFTGYPAAYFVPSQGESDYETTSEDMRMYVFTIGVLYPIESDGNITSQALSSLYDAIDDVLDSFASDRLFTDDGLIQSSLPAGKILISVHPVSAGWNEVVGKKLIEATINLQIGISVDIT